MVSFGVMFAFAIGLGIVALVAIALVVMFLLGSDKNGKHQKTK